MNGTDGTPSGVIAGVPSAWLHLSLTGDLTGRSTGQAPTRIRLLWGVAALSLFFSMVLAALYGARYYLPMSWLDIPWMRALHGTANAFGFGLAGLVGWFLSER